MATVRKTVGKKTETRRVARKMPLNGKRARVGTNHKTPVGAKPTQPTKPAPVLNQREKLPNERAQVELELERLRAELQEAPEPTGDEVDLNVYEREKTLGLVATYERRLEEIDAALRAAEKGQYGICERCGQPIDRERLKIFPETRMCVKCKNETEQLARRMMR
jgi:RNA polymerase-binding protein DksA